MTEHPVLTRLASAGVRLGLQRLRDFLQELGDPHLCAPVVHVAGSNGKGSVVRMLEGMALAKGLKVGTYTSPHLQRVNERIRVGGSEIDDQTLAGLLDELDERRRVWADEGDDDELSLTYFEMVTAVAFQHFARQQVDLMILEVGLGGRLDATNVVPHPVSTAITTVGMDHTDVLGPDLASIAAEKAGIIKQGVPVVVGALPPPAMKVVRAVAGDKEATLYVPDVDFRVQGRREAFTYAFKGQVWRDLVLGLEGAHQLANAGVAITASQVLPHDLRPGEDEVRRALRAVKNPGRLEWLAPDLLVDCCHNVDGAAALAAHLRGMPRDRPRTLLIGVSKDKDVRAMVTILAPCVDRVMTTRCSHPRAAAAGELAERLVGVDVSVLPSGPIEEALPSALGGDGLVIVAGSVFVVGAVRDIVGAR